MIYLYASVNKGPSELVDTFDDVDIARNRLFELREEAPLLPFTIEYWTETSED